MRILPLFLNFNNTKQSIKVENNQYDYSQQRLSLLRTPQADCFQRITFTGDGPESVSPSRDPLEKLYKHKLTCFCCGREMIEPNEIKKIEKNHALKCNAPEAIEVLSKFEKNMHSVEKEVFAILKEEAIKHPDMNFQEILQLIKPRHEDTLIKTQFGVFKLIEKASENISPEIKKQIKELIEDEKKMILEGNNQFRRKRFINRFEEIFKGKKNTATKERLIRLANKLPTAYEDKNAFIVKYSRYNPEAIGLRLLTYSMCTIEHVQPQNHNGENHIFNYIPECMRCNSFRSDRPMIQQLEEHPEMFVNSQKLLDRLIIFAEQGKLSKWYIVKIKEKVKTESEGVLDLDISKLAIPKRMLRYIQNPELEKEHNLSIEDEMEEIRKQYKDNTNVKKRKKRNDKQPQPPENTKITRKERIREKVKMLRNKKAKHHKELTSKK